MHRVFAAAVLAGTALAPAALSRAQTLAPVDEVVRLDVVVTDRQGQVVPTLGPADFAVSEDGRDQPLDGARFVHEGPRVFAIYLDEYHIAPGTETIRLRQALTAFIDEALGPDDRLVVMKPLDSLFRIRFTTDREEAKRIVAGVEGREGDYTPRTDYERNFWAGTPARIEAARAQVAISALHALAVRLGEEAGTRKSLLLVSNGFARPQRTRGQEYLATVDSLVRSANRGLVSIYGVDGRQVAAGKPTADDDRDLLRALAGGTDGLVVGGDDLETALTRALAESSGYYLLTYHRAHLEDGAFHPVSVRVKRPGVEVRARSGYWSPSAADRLRVAALNRIINAPPPPPEPARHISPLIQPWFGMARGAGGKTRVTFVWEPTDRVFGDRVRHIPSRLVLTARASDDSVVFEGPVVPTGPGSVETAGAPPQAVFDAPPGRLRLQMKIEDAGLADIDTDVRDISVRGMNGLSIGTPAVMRARNALEFRALDSDRAPVPVASREFSRTERLLIRFPVYGRPSGPTPSPSARLLNRGGKPIRALVVQPAEGGYQIDLLLAAFPPGDYQIEITATAGTSRVAELLPFRVTS